MNFIPISSSSRGNAYLVTSGGDAPLLLEAGIPLMRLREALYLRHLLLSDLAGCLVSHEHMDHAKAVKDLLSVGVDCHMSFGTASKLMVVDHHRVEALTAGKQRLIGVWTVLPFALDHDAEQPLGFFIEQSGERLLFIPDTGYVRNRFVGINILAIEANNIEEKLSANVLNGSIPPVVAKRIRRNHMSLERVIQMLKANDLSVCRQIFLLHLSDGNSDERRMVRAVEEATGIPCFACEV